MVLLLVAASAPPEAAAAAGCTDPAAANAHADRSTTTDDGSCVYVCAGLLQVSRVHCFRSHSNSNMLTHPARGRRCTSGRRPARASSSTAALAVGETVVLLNISSASLLKRLLEGEGVQQMTVSPTAAIGSTALGWPANLTAAGAVFPGCPVRPCAGWLHCVP